MICKNALNVELWRLLPINKDVKCPTELPSSGCLKAVPCWAGHTATFKSVSWQGKAECLELRFLIYDKADDSAVSIIVLGTHFPTKCNNSWCESCPWGNISVLFISISWKITLVAKRLRMFLKIFKFYSPLILKENLDNLNLSDYKQSLECVMKNIFLDLQCSGFREWLLCPSCVTLANETLLGSISVEWQWHPTHYYIAGLQKVSYTEWVKETLNKGF